MSRLWAQMTEVRRVTMLYGFGAPLKQAKQLGQLAWLDLPEPIQTSLQHKYDHIEEAV